MTSAISQQSPVGIDNPYKNPSVLKRYGVSSDEMREFKNKEASEEDYRKFIVSDSMSLSYERTTTRRVYFENAGSNSPLELNLTLPKDSFPTRANNGFFFLSFRVYFKLPKYVPPAPPPTATNEAMLADAGLKLSDVFRPSPNKFLKMVTQAEVIVGANSARLNQAAGCSGYHHRFMDMAVRPISRSNVEQEYALMDLFAATLPIDALSRPLEPDGLSDVVKDKINVMWKILNIDSNKRQSDENDVEIRAYMQFVVPLTAVHPLFNHDSVLPPGLDLSFSLKLLGDSQTLGEVLFPFWKSDYKGQGFRCNVRPRLQESFLQVEKPQQQSQFLMTLKTKDYLYDVFVPKYFRLNLEKNQDQTIISKIDVVSQSGRMPVAISFMLFDYEEYLKNSYTLRDVCEEVLNEVVFSFADPFPHYRTIKFDAAVDRQTGDYSEAGGYYQSGNNFGTAGYGEQHVVKGFYPWITKINPLSFLGSDPVLHDLSALDQSALDYLKLSTRIQPQFQLILPSNQLNQYPFPDVRGRLQITFRFREKKAMKLLFVANLYHYNRIHIQNDKCLSLPLDDLGLALDEAKK